MKKALNLLLLMLLILAVLPGCAKRGTTASPSPAATASSAPLPSPSPSVLPSASPEISPSPEVSASPETSALPDNAAEGIDEAVGYDFAALQTEVEKLSEISTCVLCAKGKRAVVGVTFDPAYQGTLTSRIVEMVGQQITAKEPGITEVAVTADPKLFSEIEALAAETKGDPTMKDKSEQFDTLFQQLKPTVSNQTDK